jgi:hypothetical protein
MSAQVPNFTPLPPESSQPETAPPAGRQSFVTKLPEEVEGHNFNPRLRAQYSNEPGVVHAGRPIEPKKGVISDELRKKHEDSVAKFPFLNLSEGEYVILNIQRHPIGLWIPVGTGMFLIILLLSGLFIYPTILEQQRDSLITGGGLPGFGFVALIVILVSVLVGIMTYIAAWIYLRNQFFLTNESVIQELQYGLFSHHEQTASLGSIEDVSYKQHGILQTMLNYGSIRLSTEGEETTYRFYYVSNPKRQTATLTNAVEAFKNGRPVGED